VAFDENKGYVGLSDILIIIGWAEAATERFVRVCG
jgi:hypothetical protein